MHEENKCLLDRFIYIQVAGLNKGRSWKDKEAFRSLERLMTSPPAVDVTPLARMLLQSFMTLVNPCYCLAAHVSLCKAPRSLVLCYAEWNARTNMNRPVRASVTVT